MTDLSTPQAAALLLTTKLHRPTGSAPTVPRPRLLRELTAGLNQRLTLISAPAGYGKTTLVNQWLDSVDLPYAWISLDEHDSDLATFLNYLLAAVRTIYPAAGHISELLLHSPEIPVAGRLADSVLHDLAALAGPLILVIDDYHMIQSMDVHQAVARFVQYMPAHIHLVLTARADPPLSLERLRGRQLLTEIRAADLRFTLDEVDQLMQHVLGSAATDEATALLEESTEGWAVGLQLAAISLRGRSDPAAFARSMSQNSHQLVADYLFAEVLEGLPEAQRACLLQTSLLDRFCAPLCDAIRGDESKELAGDDFVRAVRRANLFLVALDDEGTWFRYHQLFRRMLQNRLRQFYSDPEIKTLHARASIWFAAHGLLDDAIAHAVKAGDTLRAATLVEDYVHLSLDREDWRQVERWIGLLPADMTGRPKLLVAQAWLHYIRFQVPIVVTLLNSADIAMTSEPASIQGNETTLRGEISTLRAAIAYNQNDAQKSVRWAEAAVEQLRPEMQYARGLASYFYIGGLHATGQTVAAVEFAHRQLEAAYARRETVLAMRLLLALCNIYYETAELPALQAAATTLQQLANQAGSGLSIAWSYCTLGWVHYQRNQLTVAEQYFRNLVPIAYAAHGRAVFDGYTGLVLTALAQGHAHDALTDIASLRQLLLERGMLAFSPIVESLQQRVSLVCEPSSALSWRYSGGLAQAPILFWEQPVLTQVRTLLARGNPDDLAQADELLSDSRARAKARSTIRRLIEVEALEALVTLARGDEATALIALQQAVEMAAPGGALRLLVDCGPGLIDLLQKLQATGMEPGYIQQVLAAYDPSVASAAALIPSQDSKGRDARPDTRVEMLTNREIDVLILLAERLSDKEIATRLVLSPETVKKHTAHIYRKLGVDNRRAAAVQARLLGLL